MAELEEAIERVIAGPEKKSRVMSVDEKKMIAYHEAGHAVVAKFIPNADPVHKISIVPRGPALGYTLQLPTEDRYLSKKQDLLNQLVVLLGGRAAEKIFFNELTTGAHNDLSRASQIAKKMVYEYGMSENLGPLTYRRPESEVFLGRDISHETAYSNKTLEILDKEMSDLVNDAYAKAQASLLEHKPVVEKLVERLLKKETVSADEFDKIAKGEEIVDEEIIPETENNTDDNKQEE